MSFRQLICFILQIILCAFLFINRVQSKAISEAVYQDSSLHPVLQNGLYGYANDSGAIVLPCQWRYAGEFRGAGYAMVRQSKGNNEVGIIDTKGNYVIKFSGSIEEGQNGVYCGGMHTGVYWLDNGKNLGFFDVTTGYFSGFIFHNSQDIWCSKTSNLIRVSIDGDYYGYVNSTSGYLQIPYIFTGNESSDFVNGYAIDTLDNTYVVIDEWGNIVPLSDGLVPIELGDLITVRDMQSELYGFADYKGNCVISPQYDEVSAFRNGFASICQNGKWGHIDLSGRLCSPPIYDTPYWFNGKSFVVMVAHNTLLIDQDGNILREFPTMSEVSYFTNDMILVATEEKTILIDLWGKEIIGIELSVYVDSSRGLNVSEGLIIVQNQQGYWGYANLSGDIVGNCIWDYVEPFSNGWALVHKGRDTFFIDHSMNIVFINE